MYPQKLTPMKKVSLLLVLLLAGCKGRGFEDVRVTSVRLVSISPEGLTRISAVAEVGVHNPSARLTLTDLTDMDPEQTSRGYPIQRSYGLTLNLGF